LPHLGRKAVAEQVRAQPHGFALRRRNLDPVQQDAQACIQVAVVEVPAAELEQVRRRPALLAQLKGRVASSKNAPGTPGVVAAKCTLVS